MAPGFLSAVALAALVFVAGCYNPKIKPGGFRCNDRYEKPYDCPEGHYCLNGFCQKSGAPIVDSGAAGTDGGVDKPDGSMDKPPSVDVLPDVPDMGMCLGPVASCVPDPTLVKCDPFCQSGCGCKEKCSVSSKGALTCNPMGPGALKMEGQGCQIANDELATQADNCAPGLACIHDTCAEVCVRFCRTNTDCPSGLCNRNLGGGVKACSFVAMECNPNRLEGDFGCAGGTQGCYLSATVKDRTLCDCSSLTLLDDQSCNVSKECVVGLVCADVSGSGLDLRCRRACSLASTLANKGCNAGRTCEPHLGSAKYGFCK
jgi:hypothetical protein